jgi:maleamate amidohydrolase
VTEAQARLRQLKEVGVGIDSLLPGSQPAVLVVDFQRLFVEGELASPDTAEVLARSAEVLTEARRRGVPVYYVRVVYGEAGEAGVTWLTKCPAMAECVEGQPATEIHPSVAPTVGDVVIDKKRASAFFDTDLDDRLRSDGVDTLAIIGTSTSGCVRASAVDAASLDYRVFVLTDCVDDRAPQSAESALVDLQAKYAEVLASSTFFEYLIATTEGS